MDEQSVSPDSAVGSMMLTQKKDKICLVCGDKALGYNFNAVSCESCKAFFRRNAHKTIRGRCEGKCDVNVESRSFCKRCRLQKCFTVGMRKDMILDNEQKLIRKQKILINKLKRHGTLPPEDTYAVSETDIKLTYSEQLVSQSVESLKQQYPDLTDKDLEVLKNIKKEKDDGQCNSTSKLNEKLLKYEPWNDVEESLKEYIKDMNEEDQNILLEMNKAHESSSFLSTTFTQLKKMPETPTEVFNIADGFVRRIIKVAKQLQFFRTIEKEDQIAILKGSVVEIMMLRSAVNFDVKTESWNLSTLSCIKKPDGASTSSDGGMLGGLDIQALRKAAMAGADINQLRNMAMGNAGGGNMGGGNMRPPEPEPMNMTTESRPAMPMGNMEHLRNMAKQSGLDVDSLRKAAMAGTDINQLRNMAMGGAGGGHMRPPEHEPMNINMESRQPMPLGNVEHLRNMARQSGLDVDSLRKAAMGGANFNQLSQMARGQTALGPGSAPRELSNTNTPIDSPGEQQVSQSDQTSSKCTSISAEILKLGSPETKSMFLTYSKFIRSLMHIIFGDLIILKFLVMLSLFSPDRPDIVNRSQIEYVQEKYAVSLQNYIKHRFPDEKNMFARCVMKLTDLRNVNEVHTKMLLKMNVDEIEPLLVEIFDLPQ